MQILLSLQVVLEPRAHPRHRRLLSPVLLVVLLPLFRVLCPADFLPEQIHLHFLRRKRLRIRRCY